MKPLFLFNTLTRSKGEFKPIVSGQVGLYSCGPTVYGPSHIGNMRAFLLADILKRVLLYDGFMVNHIMNLTDVDDKTIRGSKAAGEHLTEFTQHHAKSFFADLGQLHILPATEYPLATDNIEQMVALIEDLLKKGYAYRGEDGSIYFNISKDADYGVLSKLDLGNRVAQSRIKNDEYAKDNVQDFALWKAWDEADGDVFWHTSLGKGRPGWHIECSAMSMRYLGQEFDIHTGGIDLLFPHHENEIAQSESVTGKKFVHYWLHNEHVLIDGKKMSKSLGNIYTLKDVQEKGFSPVVYRFLFLQTHYRQKLNFSWDALQAAQNGLRNLQDAYVSLSGQTVPGGEAYQQRFFEAINDDLNMPQALAVAWEVVKDNALSDGIKKHLLQDFDRVLGLGLDQIRTETIPNEVSALARERQTARLHRDWAKADELRAAIEEQGYRIEDTDDGFVLKPLRS